MRAIKTLALAMIAITGCGSETGSISERLDGEPATVLPKRGARVVADAGNLIDHGGLILPASQSFAIYWGSAAAWPTDTVPAMESLLQGFSGSSYFDIATQYMRSGLPPTSGFVATLTDSTMPPKRAVSVAQAVNEVCAVLSRNGIAPDPSATYFLYTANFPHGIDYCAWHSYGTCANSNAVIQVAYLPNTTNIAGCDPGDVYPCNSYSEGSRSLANVTAHEWMEMVTDPRFSAWYDTAGQEIADKCAWQFSSCVALATDSWQLQEQWSNAASGCVQQ